jgi:hypothetical protein|tara:strand:+ start:11499 stop:13391 length:1893 start_codon:yes stop_codon:yes gene_type:complete
MAQIIQHKRGVLEDLSGVTANKGELLVVTGSSISALADGLVFVGNHSDLTSVNKILTGSSSPNMASYDVGVNGLPFYNTTDKKLQILRQDGNLDIILAKNQLDLDGTGIVSSSAQVSALAGINNSTLTVTAGTNLSGGGTFTTNQAGNTAVTLNLDTDGTGFVSGSTQIISLVAIDEDNFVSNSATKVPTQQSVKAYVDSKAAAQDNTDELTEGSTNLFFTNDRVRDYVRSIDVISGSNSITIDGSAIALGGSVTTLQLGTTNSTALAGDTTTISTAQGNKLGFISVTQAVDLDTIESNTSTNNGKVGYTDALVKTKLNAETVISGSSQVDATSVANFDTNVRDYVRSIDVISGSSQVNADSITNFDTNVQSFIRATDVISGSSQVTGISNTQISGVNHSKVDFGGSNLTSGSLGLVVGDGSSTDTVNVGVDTLAIIGTANEVTTAVTNNQVQIGLPDNVTVGGNMVVSGNLTVSGDTVQTNVTNLNIQDNIINVNYGGSATDGGLYVSDVTGGNLVSGSLLWDGSNDYWKAGAKDSEARVILGNGTDTAGKITKFSADGVITDSIISESGTTVTISNDLILSGLTASSFLISNGSKQLVSVASSTDGDFLVSNGSGTYSATNIIDGGSF